MVSPGARLISECLDLKSIPTFQGLENVNKRPAVVFPALVVCVNCGKAEFPVPNGEFNVLVETEAT
jgi:hypothetical protein